MEVEIQCRYADESGEPFTLEAIFRNGAGDYIFRWVDAEGRIRVLEECHPQATRFYHLTDYQNRKRG